MRMKTKVITTAFAWVVSVYAGWSEVLYENDCTSPDTISVLLSHTVLEAVTNAATGTTDIATDTGVKANFSVEVEATIIAGQIYRATIEMGQFGDANYVPKTVRLMMKVKDSSGKWSTLASENITDMAVSRSGAPGKYGSYVVESDVQGDPSIQGKVTLRVQIMEKEDGTRCHIGNIKLERIDLLSLVDKVRQMEHRITTRMIPYREKEST
jgi:hypothetical protein